MVPKKLLLSSIWRPLAAAPGLQGIVACLCAKCKPVCSVLVMCQRLRYWFPVWFKMLFIGSTMHVQTRPATSNQAMPHLVSFVDGVFIFVDKVAGPLDLVCCSCLAQVPAVPRAHVESKLA